MNKNLPTKFFMLPIWLGLFALPLFYSSFFDFEFSLPKWCLIYFIVILCLINILFFLNEIYFPKLNKKLTILGILGIVFFIFNLYYHQLPYPLSSCLDDFCFFVLVIYFYQIFHVFNIKLNNLSSPILLSTSIFLFFSIKSFILYNFYAINNDNVWSYSFGNPNMAAEFLGISLIFQLYFIDKKTLKNIHMFSVLFILTLIMIYFYRCRSIYIFTILGLLYVLLNKNYTRKKMLVFCVLLSISSILCIEILIITAKSSPSVAEEVAKKDFSSRVDLYLDSLNIIKKYPLGIGKGKYEFTSIPYSTYSNRFLNENEIYKSPHNEFLRIAVEDGLPYAFILFVFGGILYFDILRVKVNRGNVLIVLVLLFMIIQMAFQFPFDNAFPFLFFSLITSYLFSCKPHDFCLKINYQNHCIILLVGLLISIEGLCFIVSNFISHNFNNIYDCAKISCALYPSNWRACLDQAQFEKDSREVFVTLNRELMNNPFNFYAINLWADAELAQERKIDACETSALYNSLFLNNSTLKNFITDNCRNTVTLRKDDFLSNYLHWMKKRQITSTILPVRGKDVS